ncbi:MAG: FAD-binding oxidoreductase [Gemmatimonadaceae bacterium]|nr:FAD-binding oxidoreductase [Gemmatimonadaceae bacterium]
MTAAPPHPAGLPRWDDHDDLPLPSLAGDAEADLCVVGLGGSGLACLTEAMALGATRVIGVDATGIAAGAAGRNGGFLLSGTSEYHHDLVRLIGRDAAVALTRLTNEEIQRIAREVPAAVRLTGSLRIASDEAEFADCEAQRAQMAADGFTCEAYAGPEGRGLLIPTDAAMHPLRRCRTLAARLLERGARLRGGTRALEIADGRVRTDRGTLRARHIIICVDGGLERVVPTLAGEVRSARLQMLASAPDHAVRYPRPVSTRWGYDYWQQLPDGSVVLGGGRDTAADAEWTADPAPSEAIQAYLTRMLRERLGVQASVTHRWGATVSYTTTGRPIFRDLGGGVRVVGAYSGTGNVVGALLGRAAAQLALTGRSAIADVVPT